MRALHSCGPPCLHSTHRTFSPSDVAYWDFGTKAEGQQGCSDPLASKGSGGLFSKITSFFTSSK